MIQKIYSQIHPVSYINTHHDAIRFGKSWDGEKYINLNILRTEHDFCEKKKIISLCPRWHSLRSYHCALCGGNISRECKDERHLSSLELKTPKKRKTFCGQRIPGACGGKRETGSETSLWHLRIMTQQS